MGDSGKIILVIFFVVINLRDVLRQAVLVNCDQIGSRAECLVWIERDRNCLVPIFEVIWLCRHLVVVVGLLQGVDSLCNLAHLFDRLVNLSCILQESLACD